MGASTFVVSSSGATAEKAFNNAVTHARWESGNGGYTGTIAEKHSFILLPLGAGMDATQRALELLDQDDGRVSDKWGPAGCFSLGEGRYLFFGWASS